MVCVTRYAKRCTFPFIVRKIANRVLLYQLQAWHLSGHSASIKIAQSLCHIVSYGSLCNLATILPKDKVNHFYNHYSLHVQCT
jgi:hypothetical protein